MIAKQNWCDLKNFGAEIFQGHEWKYFITITKPFESHLFEPNLWFEQNVKCKQTSGRGGGKTQSDEY